MARLYSRLITGRVLGLSRREVLHELVVLVVIVICATALKKAGLLNPIERFVIDMFAATEPTAQAGFTAIIDIDETSFSGPEFNRQQPLNHDALARLIIAAGRAGAGVIVVDIDTDVKAVQTALAIRKGIPSVPIVWAAVTRECSQTHCVIATDPLSAVPDREAGWVVGLTTLIHDGDDVLRRYKPTFETAREQPDGGCECSGEQTPTLARAAALAYRKTLPVLNPHDGDAEPLLLNWRAGRWFTPRFPASEVLRNFEQTWWPTAAKPLEGKIVLVGGTFTAGRDVRRTPAGEMAGVEVLAHIVESELAGRGMAPYHEIYGILIEFAAGIVLTAFNILFPAVTRRRLALNALMVFIIPLAASWMLYRFSLYWASLAPVVAGVFLHQWYRRASLLAPASHAAH